MLSSNDRKAFLKFVKDKFKIEVSEKEFLVCEAHAARIFGKLSSTAIPSINEAVSLVNAKQLDAEMKPVAQGLISKRSKYIA